MRVCKLNFMTGHKRWELHDSELHLQSYHVKDLEFETWIFYLKLVSLNLIQEKFPFYNYSTLNHELQLALLNENCGII